MSQRLASATIIFAAFLCPFIPTRTSLGEAATVGLNRDDALRSSQAAIGRRLSEHDFLNRNNERVRISDFRGKPLLVSLVYTSCYHSCSVFTRYLGEVVGVAREALGEDAFSVVTIGFDAANDTPARMAQYASGQGITASNWSFLSGDQKTLDALTAELGFTYAASPKGFDHLAQVSVVDAGGRVYRQVYGDRFDPPALVEPLKELVFGTGAEASPVQRWVDNVRLFCTIYDPSTGRYRFDYSIFVAIIIGIVCLASIAVYIVRAWRESSAALTP